MGQDPHEINLVIHTSHQSIWGKGWKDPIATAEWLHLRFFEEPPWIVVLLEARTLVLSHPAAVLILQGMAPQQLFCECTIEDVDPARTFFLKGELSSPADPPTRFKEAVLGLVYKAPLATTEEIFSFLLKHVTL